MQGRWTVYAVLFALHTLFGFTIAGVGIWIAVAGHLVAVGGVVTFLGWSVAVKNWRLGLYSWSCRSHGVPPPDGITDVQRQRVARRRGIDHDAEWRVRQRRVARAITGPLSRWPPLRMILGGLVTGVLLHFVVAPTASIGTLLLVSGATAGLTGIAIILGIPSSR